MSCLGLDASCIHTVDSVHTHIIGVHTNNLSLEAALSLGGVLVVCWCTIGCVLVGFWWLGVFVFVGVLVGCVFI